MQANGSRCQNMIMIFSDGAERRYQDVFEKYNKDKKVSQYELTSFA